MKNRIITLVLLLSCMLNLQAQSNTGTLGGEATGSGGTASFTAGEVFYSYKSGASGSVTEGVQQSYRVLPTGVISGGSVAVCAGSSVQLSIALTGEGPWFGTLSDGTGFSGSDNPLLVTVTPSETTTYTIATLSSETATAIASGLSGSAEVEVKQPTIWYADTDMDTFGDMAVTQSSCIQPPGYVSNSLDCNDNSYSLTNSCNSIVNLKLFIEGYYIGAGTMTSVVLNQAGGNATDVEMVTVELFDAALAPITSTTAMLHTDGTCQAVFTNSPTGAYYVAVRGSNSIRTWTAFKQTVGNTPLTYDFSTGAAQAAGGNMKDLGSGVYGFYSGDLDLPVGDGFIDLPDYSIWEADYNLGNVGVYPTDLDGDAFVDLPDYSIWEANYTTGIIEIQP